MLEVLAESRVTVEPPAASAPRATACPGKRCAHGWKTRRARKRAMRCSICSILPLTVLQSDFAAYGAMSFPPGRPMLAGAMELMNRIHKDFRYDTTVTDVVHAGGQGVRDQGRRLPGPGPCRPSPRCAAIGLPARYVSGYLLTHPPPGRPRLLGATPAMPGSRSGRRLSAGSTWIPPTIWWWAKAMSPPAWGRDYGDVAPVAGHHPGRPRPCG